VVCIVAVAFIAPVARNSVAAAPESVDTALILAADVSRSINDREFDLQRHGYAAAIVSPQVLEAIHSGERQSIALAFVEWAGSGEEKVVVDWSVIRSDADAAKFAAAILAAPRSYTGRTAIGSAVTFAMGLFGESGIDAGRHVIDVSGDGTNNLGPAVELARDAAVQAGAVINGLAIYNKEAAQEGGYLELHTNPPGGIAKYYREHVTGGSGSFVLNIETFDTFGEAMIRKLVSEIAAVGPIRTHT
jgi:hypothetical protein